MVDKDKERMHMPTFLYRQADSIPENVVQLLLGCKGDKPKFYDNIHKYIEYQKGRSDGQSKFAQTMMQNLP